MRRISVHGGESLLMGDGRGGGGERPRTAARGRTSVTRALKAAAARASAARGWIV